MRSPFARTSKSLGYVALGFVAGACATQLRLATAEPLRVGQASVIQIDQAHHAVAPHGKAEVWHLARGHNAYIGMLELAADAAVPEHRDKAEEFIHVLEGSGEMVLDGTVHQLGPGTTIYMPANSLVSVTNGGAPMRVLQVFAGPGPAAKYEGWTED